MRFRGSITVSIAILFGLMALIGQLVSQHLASGALNEAISQREIDKVNTIGSVVKAMIDRHVQPTRMLAQLLSTNQAIVDGARSEEPVARFRMTDTLAQVLRVGGIETVEVTDRNEAVLYRAHAPDRHGDTTKDWGVSEALGGTSMFVSTLADGSLTIKAIEPLRTDGQIVGTVSAGVSLNRAFMDELSGDVGVGLALLDRDGRTVSEKASLASPIDPHAVADAFRTKVPVYRTDRATRQTSVYLPIFIVDEAFVVLAELDSSSAHRLIMDSEQRSVVSGGAVLVGTTIVGLLSLHFVMAPLRRLRERAEQTAVTLTGEVIQTKTANEVFAVVQVLDTLTDRLVQRNKELMDAKIRADEANHAKSRFLSNMSHEIRTPLNGVLGVTELLQRTRLDTEQSRLVVAITSAGRTLLDLLGDILDLAKIEEGQVRLEYTDFDAGALLGDIAAVYREVASARSLSLEEDLNELSGVWLRGDPARLRQVLTNLLGNAMKFTAYGQVSLRITRLEINPGRTRGRWRFEVEDTGIGIATEALEKIFERFAQADPSTTRQFGGSGLGLAISQYLIELMGGRIEVRSEFGKGTCFWFDLNFDIAAAQARVVDDQAEATIPHGARILVAEDNPVNEVVIRGLLHHFGARVTTVADGSKAVSYATQEAFDLVLMDCNMPIMDGYEATRRIRRWELRHPDRRKLPIIALTANALVGDRETCIAAGFNDHVAKPITGVRLATVLRRHLTDVRPVFDAHDDMEDDMDGDGTQVAFDPSLINDLPMVANGSNPEFASEMLDLFAHDMRTSLQALETAVQAADARGIVHWVHTLKGTAAQIGARALADIAGRHEKALREGTAIDQGTLIDRLKTELARFDVAVSRYRGTVSERTALAAD